MIMEKKFSGLLFNNLTDTEYTNLRKMKRKRKYSRYRIIITSDRRDYDDLSELMNYPELGKRVGIFYFNYPEELELILKAFEGLFYQLFKINETERMGGGAMDDLVFEDWWDEECCEVCECCFLRGLTKELDGKSYYTCKKGK